MDAIEGRPGAQLVIISGPSGVGKDTIIDAMRERMPAFPRHYVITVTTRDRRPTETDGVAYHFLTLVEYEIMREADGLLEASRVHRNWYGTPRDQVQTALAGGRDAVLKIDVQGARKVHAAVPETLLIFVVPPSIEALHARLLARRTESEEDLAVRRRDAEYELSRKAEYDHVVVNETDQIERTAAEIDAIIAAEHHEHASRRIRV